jgi:hypothetical protein
VWLEGYWTGDNKNRNRFNSFTMEIVKQTQSSFRFQINSNSGTHTCEISGIAKINKNNAIYEKFDEYSKETCRISFELINNNPLKYNIVSSHCDGYCGTGASFDNIYIKDKEYLVERGIINEVDILNFHKIVGSNYQDFVDSMDLIT